MKIKRKEPKYISVDDESGRFLIETRLKQLYSFDLAKIVKKGGFDNNQEGWEDEVPTFLRVSETRRTVFEKVLCI